MINILNIINYTLMIIYNFLLINYLTEKILFIFYVNNRNFIFLGLPLFEAIKGIGGPP